MLNKIQQHRDPGRGPKTQKKTRSRQIHEFKKTRTDLKKSKTKGITENFLQDGQKTQKGKRENKHVTTSNRERYPKKAQTIENTQKGCTFLTTKGRKRHTTQGKLQNKR